MAILYAAQYNLCVLYLDSVTVVTIIAGDSDWFVQCVKECLTALLRALIFLTPSWTVRIHTSLPVLFFSSYPSHKPTLPGPYPLYCTAPQAQMIFLNLVFTSRVALKHRRAISVALNNHIFQHCHYPRVALLHWEYMKRMHSIMQSTYRECLCENASVFIYIVPCSELVSCHLCSVLILWL